MSLFISIVFGIMCVAFVFALFLNIIKNVLIIYYMWNNKIDKNEKHIIKE